MQRAVDKTFGRYQRTKIDHESACGLLDPESVLLTLRTIRATLLPGSSAARLEVMPVAGVQAIGFHPNPVKTVKSPIYLRKRARVTHRRNDVPRRTGSGSLTVV
jgi:hypothetical protein